MSFCDVSELLCNLQNNSVVKYININSTMGRHYKKVSNVKLKDPKMLNDYNRGKALVLCNTHHRENWEAEQKQACFVFKQQLGLEVTFAGLILFYCLAMQPIFSPSLSY